MAIGKTNAMRILDKAGIVYTWKTYAHEDGDLSGAQVAERTGLPPETVFKTLVARGDRRGILVACIPVDRELDLKALARAADEKKCAMLPLKELQPVTGYIRGGCSPIGMKKAFPVFLDATCRRHPHIAVSAGIRGCQIVLDPEDLVRSASAMVADLVTETEETSTRRRLE